jgi:hypothetical protein
MKLKFIFILEVKLLLLISVASRLQLNATKPALKQPWQALLQPEGEWRH